MRNPNGSNDESLDKFEARILRQSNRPVNRSGGDRGSLDQLDSFEARILKKSNGSDGDRSLGKSNRSDHDKSHEKLDAVEECVLQKGSGPMSKSERARESFDERLASKLAESDQSVNLHGIQRKLTLRHHTKSDGSGSTLEERVKRKIERDEGNAARATDESSTNSFANGNHKESFEDRLSRKMKQGQHKTNESKSEQHSKTAPEFVTSNGSESSARSALDRWDEKVRKKNEGSKQDRSTRVRSEASEEKERRNLHKRPQR